jgi:O-methyltransferase
MTQPILLRDNRRLSYAELNRAKAICDEALGWVHNRDAYLREQGVDPRFALPDANWSYDSPNEFVRLFRRVAEADPQTLAHLRGLSQVFSGYNLYHVCNGYGLSAAAMELSSDLDEVIEERLEKHNQPHIDVWREMTQGMPRRFLFSPPAMMGEVGHEIDGVIVNSDTCTYQERVNLIYSSGIGDWLDERLEMQGDLRICEIGGGYGALCHWFKQAYPAASYTIVDLPESLLFARLYLSLTRPDLATSAGLAAAKHGVRFVPNYLAERLAEPFDLVINTLSMSEMSEYQIKRYAALMKQHWLADRGMFFEQNQDNRPGGLQCAEAVLKPEFPERASLRSHRGRLANGSPNIWSLAPIRLRARRLASLRPYPSDRPTQSEESQPSQPAAPTRPLMNRLVSRLRVF